MNYLNEEPLILDSPTTSLIQSCDSTGEESCSTLQDESLTSPTPDTQQVSKRKRGRPLGSKNLEKRIITYPCDVCHQHFPKDHLASKRVSFHTVGRPATHIRSHTTGRLCLECMTDDPDFQEANHGA